LNQEAPSVLIANQQGLHQTIENSKYSLFLYLDGHKSIYSHDLPDDSNYLTFKGAYKLENADWVGEVYKEVIDPAAIKQRRQEQTPDNALAELLGQQETSKDE